MTEATVVELFENHSVDEVRRICADIRNDVESRKMELRFLVGERHRDVIEASDSILCMKEYSQFVTDKLAQLESACVYKSSALSTPSRVKDQKAQDPKKLIAAQLKLLLDVSEMIWTALDEFDYSAAVEYFLLGRHLAVKMQLTSEMLAAHVNARVLVKRQWVALDHIEGTIAAACRKQIALHNVTDDMLCQALAALLVLEDQTMRASLEEFLIGRTAALKGISGADDALDSQACVDVTQRLTVMARILMQTLESVNALYLPQGQICSLLSQMSKWSPREITGFAGENLFEHLPENVVNYRITSTNQSRQAKSPCPSPTEGTSDVEPSGILACPLSAECLTDPTNRWWQSTLDLCHQHLSTALNSISDLATFVEMRTTLLNLTANVKPLGRHVDLWCEIYQSAFLDRLQVLLETHLGAIFDEFEASLLHLAKPLDQVAAPSDDVDDNDVNSLEEKDLAAFVWSQSLSGTSSIVDLQPDNSTSLQVDGDSLSLAYFACLVGRRDLVPESPTSSTDSCVPGPLRWRLSRLLDGAAKTYAAFDWCDDRHHGNSRHELNQKRRLITPALKRICSKFNRRLCETVATAAKNAAGDETPVWKVLLGVVTRLLDRCCSMAKRAIVDLKEDGGMKSRGAFCVARACFALLDVYPGLGATVVAATAKLLTEESKSYTTWTDVQRLRQVWLSTSRKLRFIAARLAYVAVLQATVQGPALEVLYSKLVSAFSASGDPDQSLVAITSVSRIC
uniref:Conserved oligomeric Golgi complex subunit 1 n=1 Tax=Mesocestoides corti TaxID=53468 RepID=A0A5K3F7Z3_MESCO